MKIALVHDWLTGMRGGERVLEIFCRLFPSASIFTLFHFPGTVSDLIQRHPIITSRLQRLPWKSRYRMYLPLFPSAVESFDLSSFDLIVSTSHAVAKGAVPGDGSLSVCYCHTPMRYIWDMYDTYFNSVETHRIVRWTAPIFRDYLCCWDRSTVDRVDQFIANSRFVADRISTIYQRSSSVIYPPIDIDAFPICTDPPEDFYLIVSAYAPYKRLDIAIEAFNRMQKRLVIIGPGTTNKLLQKNAKDNIEFKGFLPDGEVQEYYRRCRALIFPGIEDFGLTPLEAQASGRPVIAYAMGGVMESVIEGITGHFFHAQTPEALMQSVMEFESMTFNPETLRSHAMQYDSKVMFHHLKRYFEQLFATRRWSVKLTQDIEAC